MSEWVEHEKGQGGCVLNNVGKVEVLRMMPGD